MDSVRLVPEPNGIAFLPCCRCHRGDCKWDRIAGKAYCPECQEALVLGQAPPLTERTVQGSCACCSRQGTVNFLTYPLHTTVPVEMDLCAEHLRGLLGRRLGPSAYHQLRRQLQVLDVGIEFIFLLHEAFYTEKGRALQPAAEPD
jgi:hypothetical protein